MISSCVQVQLSSLTGSRRLMPSVEETLKGFVADLETYFGISGFQSSAPIRIRKDTPHLVEALEADGPLGEHFTPVILSRGNLIMKKADAYSCIERMLSSST